MIKKLFILCLALCIGTPTYAQKKNLVKGVIYAATAKTPAILSTQIDRQVTNALCKPHLLSTAESKKILFPQSDTKRLFYVPVSFNTQEIAVYRGFSLSNLDELENIVKNGLELDKIENRAEYAIFTSHRLETALHYSIPRSYKKAIIPVIVKIPVTQQYQPLGYNGHFVFITNVPAKYISEIMAFLEIDGKSMWYKVEWQQNKMILTPALSKYFASHELMIHYFNAQPINVGMD